MDSVGKAKVEAFFHQYKAKSYKKGQVILLASENLPYAYYLDSGWVKQYDITYKGNEIVVNTLKPGTYFMVLTALTGRPNSYYFSAGSDVRLYCAPIKETVSFVNNNPDVMKNMLIDAYVGAENLLQRMTHLMNGSARGRVIYEILFDVRNPTLSRRSTIQKLSITESELASRAGLTRETVSREVSYLKKSGLLATTPKITVIDLLQLEQALEDSF